VWRPYNETQEDLNIENSAKILIERAWDVEVIKLQPMLYGFDWALFRDEKLVAIAEFKKRSHKFGTYKTLLISSGKIANAMSYSREYDVPFILIVQWEDDLPRWMLIKNPPRPSIGFNSRGQAGDREPVCHFDINDFTLINE